MKKILCILVALLVLMTVFAGCSKTDPAVSEPAAPSTDAPAADAPEEAKPAEEAPKALEKFIVVVPHDIEGIEDMGIYLGVELGYFADEGLELEIVHAANPTDVQMISSGQGDVGVPSPAVILSQVEAGVDFHVVSMYDAVNIFGFGVRSDGDIKSWDDVKEGMSILLGDAAWELLCYPDLGALGLDPTKFEYVMGGDARFQMLANGQADMVLTWISEIYQMQGQGYEFDYLDGNDVYDSFANPWVAGPKTMAEKPEQLKGFLRAMQKSLYSLYLSPETASDVVLNVFPALEIPWDATVGCGLGRVYQAFGVEGAFADRYINELGVGYIDLERWENLINDYHKYGIITSNEFDPADFVTSEFLPDVMTEEEKADCQARLDAYEFTSAIYLKEGKS